MNLSPTPITLRSLAGKRRRHQDGHFLPYWCVVQLRYIPCLLRSMYQRPITETQDRKRDARIGTIDEHCTVLNTSPRHISFAWISVRVFRPARRPQQPQSRTSNSCYDFSPCAKVCVFPKCVRNLSLRHRTSCHELATDAWQQRLRRHSRSTPISRKKNVDSADTNTVRTSASRTLGVSIWRLRARCCAHK